MAPAVCEEESHSGQQNYRIVYLSVGMFDSAYSHKKFLFQIIATYNCTEYQKMYVVSYCCESPGRLRQTSKHALMITNKFDFDCVTLTFDDNDKLQYATSHICTL